MKCSPKKGKNRHDQHLSRLMHNREKPDGIERMKGTLVRKRNRPRANNGKRKPRKHLDRGSEKETMTTRITEQNQKKTA